MSKSYIRAYILLPIKKATLRLRKIILSTLSREFGGATFTYKQLPLILKVMGVWADVDTTEIVKNNLLLVIVDVDSSKNKNYIKYFSDFKYKYEKELSEKELWLTYQPIMRVV